MKNYFLILFACTEYMFKFVNVEINKVEASTYFVNLSS